MKKAIFIVALIMALKPALPVLDYIINYDYIATQLCENKAKPELHCNGKCHLAKELAKASENEKPLSEKKTVTSEKETVMYCESIPSYTFAPGTVSITLKNKAQYRNLYSHLKADPIFHPPLFIS